MAKNTSVRLGEHFSAFIDVQVKRGRYGSASDVVRARLRLVEEQEANLAMLQTAVVEGELNLKDDRNSSQDPGYWPCLSSREGRIRQVYG